MLSWKAIELVLSNQCYDLRLDLIVIPCRKWWMDRVSIHEESIGRVIVSDCRCSGLGLCVHISSRVFWSILEHMGRKEHGGLGHGRSSTGYAKEEGEAILKTSSTTYSTNRSSSSTRPAKLQLDRAEKSKSNPKNVASPLTFL
ncbi:unnamed protein product [Microthlaspi erraticum]|uniref:Uncharacterized protein n=1 Tax=Microthlaspi erraticum TaxID=1685480 RepID=A0A6D2L9N2_9BRAS|nr:unnamed protein product [Microthlaspi erraticum]